MSNNKVMSKKDTNVMSGLMYDSAIIFGQDDHRFLEGRILTIIDSLGLKDTQEKAIKDLIRNEIWDFSYKLGVIISPEDHKNLKEKGQYSREATSTR